MPESLIGPRASLEPPRISGVRFVDPVRPGGQPAPAVLARRRALVAAAAVFVVLFAGGLTLIGTRPTRYAATTVVSFMPRAGAGVGADTVQMAGQKYVVIATSATTAQTAATAVGMTADSLSVATSATLDVGTGNVEVTVELTDRARAVAAANAVAGVLVKRSVEDQLVLGETTSPAVGSRAQVKPARNLLALASGLAAALAAVLAWQVMRAPTWLPLRQIRLRRRR